MVTFWVPIGFLWFIRPFALWLLQRNWGNYCPMRLNPSVPSHINTYAKGRLCAYFFGLTVLVWRVASHMELSENVQLKLWMGLSHTGKQRRMIIRLHTCVGKRRMRPQVLDTFHIACLHTDEVTLQLTLVIVYIYAFLVYLHIRCYLCFSYIEMKLQNERLPRSVAV